jgi:predicted acylesterase/phospholipase RssA
MSLKSRDSTLIEHSIVCAGVADVNSAVRLRSYSSRWEQSKGCTVWEAARATSAAPLYFDPISFGVPPMKYIDGALRYNNPVRVLYDETKSEWPGRPIACVVSIGIPLHTVKVLRCSRRVVG